MKNIRSKLKAFLIKFHEKQSLYFIIKSVNIDEKNNIENVIKRLSTHCEFAKL